MQPFLGFGRHVVARSINKARRTGVLRAVYINGPTELARICPQRVAWIGPSVRASSECELSTIFCEAAGVVSIARIDRAPPVIEQFELLQRARAASTETMPAVSPTLFRGRAFREQEDDQAARPYSW